MDDNQLTTVAPVPEPVFSADDKLSTLLIKAYQGEVSGEVLFGRLSQRSDDADHRHKLEVLRLLEARTRNAMVPAMRRNGLPTDPDPEVEHDAETLADGAASLGWSDLVAAFEPITTQFIDLYERIGELAAGEDLAVAELLVAHEVALREFGRRELSGRGNDSLDEISALPHMR
jgi:hypothetical protein